MYRDMTNEVVGLLIVLLSCGAVDIRARADAEAKTAHAATGPLATTRGTSPPSAQLPQRASPKVIRYAKRLIAQYDSDLSGDLTATEWGAMRGQPDTLDHNRDGTVLLAEMVSHITAYSWTRRLGGRAGIVGLHSTADQQFATQSAPAQEQQNASEDGITDTGRGVKTAKPYHVPARLLPSGLPGWFTERDHDGDGQLSIAEYAPTSNREAVATFTRLDTDRDGLLTPAECMNPSQRAAIEEPNQ